MPASTERKMASGASWMVLFKLVERSLGLVSTLILVRLLSPHDFGLVAMALSFILMAELLTGFGFDVDLIQNQAADERHYHTAWTCNMLVGLGIFLHTLVGKHFVQVPACNSDFYLVLVCVCPITQLESRARRR